MAAQCNLIIDSCCDLPLSMLQIEGVDTLNFNYVMSDGDHEDDFYQSITPHEFYEKIRNGETPSTSQASPAAIEAAWRALPKTAFSRYTYVSRAAFRRTTQLRRRCLPR
jgi:DegV family protein